MYTVYKLTAPNGKIYIGQTSMRPEKRWKNGRGYERSPHMYNAIKKYGWESFSKEIIATDITKEEADKLESKLIKELGSQNPDIGYNIKDGGSHGQHSLETRKKIANASVNMWKRDGFKEMMHEIMSGRKSSPEAKEHISAALKGRPACRKTTVVCIETGEIFDTMKKASEFANVPYQNISEAALGKRQTAGGYHWAIFKEAA